MKKKISKYEDYIAKYLKGGIELNFEDDGSVIKVGGIDYKIFKLFQLSILWRASISTRELFQYVNLGKHEEIIREMLLSEESGKEEKYGCIIKIMYFNSMILSPNKSKINGHIFYKFSFGASFVFQVTLLPKHYPHFF